MGSLVSPTLSGLATSVVFLENAVNAAPALLDSAVVFGASGSMNGGTLLVSGLLAEDRVSVLNTGSGAGQIGFSGGQVSYGGTVFGTASGGSGTSFSVSFNSNVTTAAVDALIEALTFADVSHTPTASRTLTLYVTAQDGSNLGAAGTSFAALSGTALSALAPGTYSTPAFVDLDGDGKLDLVSGTADGTLKAWRNTGSGYAALTGAANPFNGIDVGQYSTPAFVDLDGDGKLDLVSGTGTGGFMAWRNTGSGYAALTGAANPFNGFSLGQYSTPSFFDVDNDGRLDLVSGCAAGTVSVWRNTGSGYTALTGAANPFNAVSLRDTSPSFFDVDGDGRKDLVLGDYDAKLQVWLNTAGGFVLLDNNSSPFKSFDLDKDSAPAFVDVDGDGLLDLVAGSSTGPLVVWRNTSVTAPSITVTVTAQDDAPVITSGATASFAENGTGVAYQASATDLDNPTLTWSLAGVDAAFFSINAATGAVGFKTPPAFEAALDAGGNNTYDITVIVSDGTLSASQAVAISVTDVFDSDVPHTLVGGANGDVLTGGNMGDWLSGGAGGDTLDGGLGADTMEGGTGDDCFSVDDEHDDVRENAGEGRDKVKAHARHTLTANVEDLEFTGTGDFAGTGNGLGNLITANSGSDTLSGLAGDDTLVGANGSDSLLGGTGNDSLTGGAGADTLDGGAGIDNMAGGIGDDSYVVDNAADVVTEAAGEGTDSVIASIAYTLGATLENLTLTGLSALTGTGNAAANRLQANDAGNTLYGLTGADTLLGGAGNDKLDGGSGADSMAGGAGNDSYLVDDVGDRLFENAGAGTDIVSSSVDWTLGADVENLTLTGATGLRGTGNALANIILGTTGGDTLDGAAGNDSLDAGAGDDSLAGGSGADTLRGGAGNDTFSVDDAADLVLEDANAGTDLVIATASYTLPGTVENLTLGSDAGLRGTTNALNNLLLGAGGNDTLDAQAGNDTVQGNAGNDSMLGGLGNDSLSGGAGNDTLDGGIGADSMAGGAGDDSYVVDNAADVVTEAAGEGTDSVVSAITYTLADTLENLALTGTMPLLGTGNSGANLMQVLGSGNDTLLGLGGADTLLGGTGNDSLDGGAGADSMAGGAGNDTYAVDDIGDRVTEAAASGTDLVVASVDFTLGSDLENLTLIGATGLHGTGNALNNLITGGTGDDTLLGGTGNDTVLGLAGNDSLDGGSGNDSMAGGAGNDTYSVDSATDMVSEGTDGGTDLVRAALSFILGANIENLELLGATGLLGTGNERDNAITGTTGNDTLLGNAGNDSLAGGAGNDSLSGGLGADTLDGGAGNDSMAGGLGADTYVLDSLADVISEGADTGIDTVVTGFSYTLLNNFENLVLHGAGPFTGTGNLGNNDIVGDAGADTLLGLDGNDSLHGGAGADSLAGGTGDDVLDGGTGNDTLAGGRGNDTYVIDGAGDVILEESVAGGIDLVQSSIGYTLGALLEKLQLLGNAGLVGTGNAGNNSITGGGGADTLDGLLGNDSIAAGAGNDSVLGGGGNDTLDGGTGDDTLSGGAGHDTYVVDSLGDVIVEAANGGTDLVKAWLDYTLAANLENLTLLGTLGLHGTGNAGNNSITGAAGGDTLDGLDGNDTLVGGAGADSLAGSAGNDCLVGGLGNDTLVGGAGNDTLAGSSGNDFYIVDSSHDLVTETGGQDTVQAAVDYTLGNGVEQLLLLGDVGLKGGGNGSSNLISGTAGADTLTGYGGNDSLLGNAGNDSLDGGLGNDSLDGGLGADTLRGGAGSDSYAVDDVGDVVIEAVLGGTDTVRTSIAYTLLANVENLVITGAGGLLGTGNAMNNVLTGNAGADTLLGEAGNDTLRGAAGNDSLDGGLGNDSLDGGAGADSMAGGAGNDTYGVDDAGDRITEADGGGIDLVLASASYTLDAGVEKLTLLASATIDGIGNALDNLLLGSLGNNLLRGLSGNDSISASAGDDTLEGGLGTDTLDGGAGHDLFRFLAPTEGGDSILGYRGAEDTLRVSAAGFGNGLVAGMDLVASGHYVANLTGVATAATAQFVFHNGLKQLWWDDDGTGAHAAVLLATFASPAAWSGSEIQVIA